MTEKSERKGSRQRIRAHLLLIRQLNQNRLALDFHGVGEDVLAGGAAQDFAGTHVELRAVPGAGEDVIVEFALIEGTADVRAVVGKGVDGTVYPCQADRLAIYLYRHEVAVF